MWFSLFILSILFSLGSCQHHPLWTESMAQNCTPGWCPTVSNDNRFKISLGTKLPNERKVAINDFRVCLKDCSNNGLCNQFYFIMESGSCVYDLANYTKDMGDVYYAQCCTGISSHTFDANIQQDVIKPMVKCHPVNDRLNYYCPKSTWTSLSMGLQWVNVPSAAGRELQDDTNDTQSTCRTTCENNAACLSYEINASPNKEPCILNYGKGLYLRNDVTSTNELNCCFEDLPMVTDVSMFCGGIDPNIKTTGCLTGDSVMWSVENMGTNGLSNHLRDHECQLQCLTNANCIGVEIDNKNSQRQCHFNYATFSNTSDVFHLRCCKISPNFGFIKTQEIVHKYLSFGTMVKSKAREKCANPIWVKMAKSFLHGEITILKDLRLTECQNKCNTNIACIVFQFRDNGHGIGDCITKYQVGHVTAPQTVYWVTYALKCLDNIPIVTNSKDFCDSSTFVYDIKSDGCENGYSVMWSVENMGSNISLTSTIRDKECQLKCLKNETCLQVEIENKNGIRNCHLNNKKYSTSSDVFLLRCCKIDPNIIAIQSTEIISETYQFGTIVKSRTKEVCRNPLWIKRPNSYMHGEIDFFINFTQTQCRDKCNDNVFCVVFQFKDYGNGTTECITKYREGYDTVPQTPSWATYALKCLDDQKFVTDYGSFCDRSEVVSDIKIQECPIGYLLTWSVENMGKNGLSNQIRDIECQLQCLKNSTCVKVEIENTNPTRMCRFDNYHNNTNQVNSDADIFVLRCCRLDENVAGIYSNVISDKGFGYGKMVDMRAYDSCPYSLWMKMPVAFENGEIAYLFNISKSECHEKCNRDIFCAAFHFKDDGNGNTKCVTKFRLGHITAPTTVSWDSYALKCISSLPILTNAIDYCDFTASDVKFNECASGFEHMWSVENMGTNSSSGLVRDHECQLQCLKSETCIQVEIKNNNCQRFCHLHDNDNSAYSSSSDVFLLRCCKVNNNIPVIRSDNLIYQTLRYGVLINKRTKEKCANPLWVKMYDSYWHGEIAFFENQNVNECREKCNDNIFCAVFQFKKHSNGTKECVIKYHEGHTTAVRRDGWISFSLKCINNLKMITGAGRFCQNMTLNGKEHACEQGYDYMWSIDNMGTNGLINQLRDYECQLKCLLNETCQRVEIENMITTRSCRLSDYVSDPFENSSDVYSLRCCKGNYDTVEAVRSDDLTNQTLKYGKLIQSRINEKCAKSLWVKTFHTYLHGEISFFTQLSIDECKNKCNQDIFCFIFHYQDYQNGTTECITKYREGHSTALFTSSVVGFSLKCITNLPILTHAKELCDNNVSAYEIKEKECKTGYSFYWFVENMGTKSFVNTIRDDECQMKCLINGTCLGVEIKNDLTERRCIFDNTGKKTYSKSSDVFVLRCCQIKKDINVITTKNSIQSTFTNGIMISSKIKEICFDAVWVKRASYYLHGEIASYSNLNGHECLEKCNDDLSCVVFQLKVYKNGTSECITKYREGHYEEKISNGVVAYALQCKNQPVLTNANRFCTKRTLGSKSEGCKKDFSFMWSAVVMGVDALEHHVRDYECQLKCLINSTCFRVEIRNDDNKRTCLLRSKKTAMYYPSSDVFNLVCCQYPMESSAIRPRGFSNTSFDYGLVIRNRITEKCSSALWIKAQHSFLHGELAFYSNVTLSQCERECQKNIFCTVFQYQHVGKMKGNCVTKYREGHLSAKTTRWNSFILICCDGGSECQSLMRFIIAWVVINIVESIVMAVFIYFVTYHYSEKILVRKILMEYEVMPKKRRQSSLFAASQSENPYVAPVVYERLHQCDPFDKSVNDDTQSTVSSQIDVSLNE